MHTHLESLESSRYLGFQGGYLFHIICGPETFECSEDALGGLG
jgi:hypothetical protein